MADRVAMSEAVQRELTEAAAADTTRLGDVYRLAGEGLTTQAIADRLGVDAPNVYNYRQKVRALTEGVVPTSPTIARQAAGRARTWAKRGPWSSEASEFLLALETALEHRAGHLGRTVTTTANDAWTMLERAVSCVEPGWWTTYGDLAQLTGLSNQSVGTWAREARVEGTWRILTSGGTVSPGFTWSDPDRDDDPRQVLTAEGVTFDDEGRAAQSSRLTAQDLADLIGGDGDASAGSRAWLLKGQNVNGVDLTGLWQQQGFCSVAASRVTRLTLPATRAALAALVEDRYADRSYDIRAERLSEFDAFLNRMGVDDLVLTPIEGGQILIGRITGSAELTGSEDNRSNLRRSIDWLNSAEPVDFGDLPAGIASRLHSQRTLVEISSDVDAVESLLRATPSCDDAPTPEPLRAAILPAPPVELAESLHVDLTWLTDTTDLLRQRGQVIFYGPPGTGKTYLALKLAKALAGDDQVSLVQFHPAYSYEDFFEGFRPTKGADGQVSFELRPGPLKRLVGKAVDNPGTNYILIVDEINRANLAKVFGELYFLLEYRDQSVELLYAGQDDPPFSLPSNVYLIGTMNTADRSIALVDAAMRRRFAFLALHPDQPPTAGVLRRWLRAQGLDEWLADLHDALNKRIEDDDFKIGPSYFMRPEVHDDGGLDRMWRTSILPLLEEHHFGDGTDVARQYSLESLRRQAVRAEGEDGTSAEATAGDEPIPGQGPSGT